MKEMPAGKFKELCLAVMDEVQATGETVVVTKRGKPVAKVVPADSGETSIFGFMAGRVQIVGDIESPVTPLSDWKVMKK
ncbi:MAG TPA: type II toxin-antitoxin system prevent-host-death family antitoxin [Candidatus Acidoferrales bacterium]|nr:type II toxin-antitoxin system prevent-host-death family antitoxin [Candidatus Acidoferrales bacterium]